MGDADWVNAIATVLTFVTTAIIGCIGWRLSLNQVKPFLYIDVTCGKDHTIVKLKNEGLGPAKITKVKYRLKDRKDDDLSVSKWEGDYSPWREDTARAGERRPPASPLAKPFASEHHTIKTMWKSLRSLTTQRAPLGCHSPNLDGPNTKTNSNDTYLLEAEKVIPGARLGQFTNSKENYKQTSDLAGRVIRAGADVEVLQAYIRYNREQETQQLVDDPTCEQYAKENRPGKAWQAALENKLAYGEVHIEYEDANGRRMKDFTYQFEGRKMSKKDLALQAELDSKGIRQCLVDWGLEPDHYMRPEKLSFWDSLLLGVLNAAPNDVETANLTDQQQRGPTAVAATSGSVAQTSMQAAGCWGPSQGDAAPAGNQDPRIKTPQQPAGEISRRGTQGHRRVYGIEFTNDEVTVHDCTPETL